LYWLAANLAERQPLVLSVDDVQWADPASAAWLLYLARRLDDLALMLIVAVRSGEPQTRDGVLAGLVDSERGERVSLAPLSQAASARVVRDGWPGGADDDLCRASFEVTAGNPFLLRELVRALRSEPATSGPTPVERVRSLTPRTVSRSVIARLGRLPVAATPLARALAVLGGRAPPREVLALAGVGEEPGMTALAALEREQIAGGRPLRFVHPLVGTAIYGDLPPATRSLEHARAARVLATAGADADRIASHLLQTEPAGNPWTVGILREAAREATQAGAPEVAVRWLGRALAEPPELEDRALVLHELGAAELRSGLRAEEHLAEAVRSAREPTARAQAALDWGDALWAGHRYVDAVHAFDCGIEAVRATDDELALRIEVHATAAARLDLRTCLMVSRRLERFGLEPPATPAGRLIAGLLAMDRALAGDPVTEVVRLADRMLEDGHLPRGHVGAQIPLFAINALLWCDRFDAARRLLDEMIEVARAGGSARGAIIALCWRGEAARRRGALAEAAGDLATAVELSDEHGTAHTAVTHALLAEVLLDRGDLDGARDALAPVAPPPDLPGYVGWNYVLHARGALQAAQLDPAGAAEAFVACGRRQEAWGAPNPSVLAWRSQAALAHLALGDPFRGHALAGQELGLARRFGAPRAIGIALRTLGLLARGERQLGLLREAVAVLEPSEARLEHARALADLGSALRRSNARAAAREPLRKALDLAVHCGAAPLADRARNELRATGARPRKPIRTGVDALTPVERQAAGMAAQGMSNPQIAQALFISRKTVEKRLSDAYRKLAIASRNDLEAALESNSSSRLPARSTASGRR
jgi:DNA-binding CsgD family transcriptional regulator